MESKLKTENFSKFFNNSQSFPQASLLGFQGRTDGKPEEKSLNQMRQRTNSVKKGSRSIIQEVKDEISHQRQQALQFRDEQHLFSPSDEEFPNLIGSDTLSEHFTGNFPPQILVPSEGRNEVRGPHATAIDSLSRGDDMFLKSNHSSSKLVGSMHQSPASANSPQRGSNGFEFYHPAGYFAKGPSNTTAQQMIGKYNNHGVAKNFKHLKDLNDRSQERSRSKLRPSPSTQNIFGTIQYSVTYQGSDKSQTMTTYLRKATDQKRKLLHLITSDTSLFSIRDVVELRVKLSDTASGFERVGLQVLIEELIKPEVQTQQPEVQRSSGMRRFSMNDPSALLRTKRASRPKEIHAMVVLRSGGASNQQVSGLKEAMEGLDLKVKSLSKLQQKQARQIDQAKWDDQHQNQLEEQLLQMSLANEASIQESAMMRSELQVAQASLKKEKESNEKLAYRVAKLEEFISTLKEEKNKLHARIEDVQEQIKAAKEAATKITRDMIQDTLKTQVWESGSLPVTKPIADQPNFFMGGDLMGKMKKTVSTGFPNNSAPPNKDPGGKIGSVFSKANQLSLGNMSSEGYFSHKPPSNSMAGSHPDLVFFFSEPLVNRIFDETTQKTKTVSIASDQLSTDQEFRLLVDILQSTERQFRICKEAINFESLQEMISKKPTMIHISCHGDFCDERKEFYLQFEQMGNGVLDNFYQSRLQELLGQNKDRGIKLAFISACHSEEIGNVLRKCNIPVVIAVNSETQVADEICLIFSRHFYMQLLNGETIQEAFLTAQRICRASSTSCESCCCAHSHTDDCKWKKFALKHGYDKAHELHSGKCGCNLPLNRHKITCPKYQNFMNFIRDFKDPDAPPKPVQQNPFDDPWAIPDDFDEDALVGFDQKEEECIICCCKKEVPHDESIKFILKGEEKHKKMVLFKDRQKGRLTIAEKGTKNKVSEIFDYSRLIGKNVEIQQCVEMLTAENSQRLIVITGEPGTGKSTVAQKAISYCSQRNFFKEGAYELEASNKRSVNSLITDIFQVLRLSITQLEDLLDLLKMDHVVFVFNEITEIYENDKSSFQNLVQQLLDHTQHVKLILTLKSSSKFVLPGRRIQNVIQTQPLSRFYAAKVLKSYDKKGELFGTQDEAELQKHELFENSLTNEQIQEVYMLLQSSKSMDEIAQIFKQRSVQISLDMQQKEASTLRNYDIQVILYSHMEQKYPEEKNLLSVLCQAPSGLTLNDVQDKVSLQPHYFGDWRAFLNDLLFQLDSSTIGSNELEVIQDDEEGEEDQSSEYIIYNSFVSRPQSPKDPPKPPQQQKDHGFKVIFKRFNDELGESIYYLRSDVREFLNSAVLERNRYYYFFLHIRYFSKVARQYIRNRVASNRTDFDIFVQTAEIDSGLWGKPRYSVFANIATDNELESKVVDQVSTRFEVNKDNFLEAFNFDLVTGLFGTRMKTFPQIVPVLDEIYVTYPTLLIMENRIGEAIEAIELAQRICRSLDMNDTLGKINLIQISLEIKQKKLFNKAKQLLECQNLFHPSINQLGLAEVHLLEAVRRMAEYSLNKSLAQQQQDPRHLSLQAQAMASTFSVSSFSEQAVARMSGVSQTSYEDDMNKAFDKMLMANTPNEQEMVESIEHYLTLAMNCFVGLKEELCQARVILLRATFFHKHMKENLAKFHSCLNDLMFAQEIFEAHHTTHSIKCLIFISQIFKDLNLYQEAKESVLEAIFQANERQNYELVKQATEILDTIQIKIQIHCNNLVIFLTANPLVKISDEEICELETEAKVNSHIDVYTRLLPLRLTGKQINVKSEALSRAQLEAIKECGCRMLILTSKYFDDEKRLYVEDSDGCARALPLNEIYSLLKPREGELFQVDVVFLNIQNSRGLAEVFKRLGVKHVFYLQESQPQLHISDDEIHCMSQSKSQIMEFFIQLLITRLLKEQSFFKAVTTTKGIIEQAIKSDVGYLHWMKANESSSGEKLFDSRSIDARKKLTDGQIEDQSINNGPTNVVMTQGTMVGRKKELFQAIEMIQNPNIRIVSVKGRSGFGKTRFVNEVAQFVNQHRIVEDGVYYLDFSGISTQKEVDLLFKEAGIEHMLDKTSKSPFQKHGSFVAAVGDYSEPETPKTSLVMKRLNPGKKADRPKSFLLIYDNVDTFYENASIFNWHLSHVLQADVNLTVVMTHTKKVKRLRRRDDFFGINIRPLEPEESARLIKMYCLRAIDDQDFEKERPSQLQKRSLPNDMDRWATEKLLQSPQLQLCQGSPRNLLVLAMTLRCYPMKRIEVHQTLSNSGISTARARKSDEQYTSGDKVSTPGESRNEQRRTVQEKMKNKVNYQLNQKFRSQLQVIRKTIKQPQQPSVPSRMDTNQLSHFKQSLVSESSSAHNITNDDLNPERPSIPKRAPSSGSSSADAGEYLPSKTPIKAGFEIDGDEKIDSPISPLSRARKMSIASNFGKFGETEKKHHGYAEILKGFNHSKVNFQRRMTVFKPVGEGKRRISVMFNNNDAESAISDVSYAQRKATLLKNRNQNNSTQPSSLQGLQRRLMRRISIDMQSINQSISSKLKSSIPKQSTTISQEFTFKVTGIFQLEQGAPLKELDLIGQQTYQAEALQNLELDFLIDEVEELWDDLGESENYIQIQKKIYDLFSSKTQDLLQIYSQPDPTVRNKARFFDATNNEIFFDRRGRRQTRLMGNIAGDFFNKRNSELGILIQNEVASPLPQLVKMSSGGQFSNNSKNITNLMPPTQHPSGTISHVGAEPADAPKEPIPAKKIILTFKVERIIDYPMHIIESSSSDEENSAATPVFDHLSRQSSSEESLSDNSEIASSQQDVITARRKMTESKKRTPSLSNSLEVVRGKSAKAKYMRLFRQQSIIPEEDEDVGNGGDTSTFKDHPEGVTFDHYKLGPSFRKGKDGGSQTSFMNHSNVESDSRQPDPVQHELGSGNSPGPIRTTSFCGSGKSPRSIIDSHTGSIDSYKRLFESNMLLFHGQRNLIFSDK